MCTSTRHSVGSIYYTLIAIGLQEEVITTSSRGRYLVYLVIVKLSSFPDIQSTSKKIHRLDIAMATSINLPEYLRPLYIPLRAFTRHLKLNVVQRYSIYVQQTPIFGIFDHCQIIIFSRHLINVENYTSTRHSYGDIY